MTIKSWKSAECTKDDLHLMPLKVFQGLADLSKVYYIFRNDDIMHYIYLLEGPDEVKTDEH